MSQTVTSTAQAVVVWADRYQFPPGEKLRFPAVRSRYMVWGLRGCGKIVANAQQLELRPGLFLLLPWEHSIRYHAADHDPFLVGGIHVVPAHEPQHPVVFHVAHGPDRDLWHAPYRHDVRLESLSKLVVGDLAEHASLAHLAEYVVCCFKRRDPDETEMRRLGQLMLEEFDRAAREAEVSRSVPPVLQGLINWVEAHLDRPINLDQLAEFAQCSRSTVERMTRKHLKQSAVEWIIHVKMARAKRLLISTNLPVSEVARQVGFADPYYFSRMFSAKMGESPRRCRARGRFL